MCVCAVEIGVVCAAAGTEGELLLLLLLTGPASRSAFCAGCVPVALLLEAEVEAVVFAIVLSWESCRPDELDAGL